MQNTSGLEKTITGTFWTRFFMELFTNSGQFPIANILFEFLIETPAVYLRAPDLYFIVFASLLQAYFLTLWQTSAHPRRLAGNLIGPAVYSGLEILLEGPAVITGGNHIAYWVFSLLIGLLQWGGEWRKLRSPALIAESLVRTSILFLMYYLFETHANPLQTVSLLAFFADTSHQFFGLAVILLGLSAGVAALTSRRYLDLLQQISLQLKTYSEWLLGKTFLEQIVENPDQLTLGRRERTILFSDIRGFTHWSEGQRPEDVAAMLNQFYHAAEDVLNRHAAVKFKFSADEVLAIFPTAAAGVSAAVDLRSAVAALLGDFNLGAGIGLHSGPVVEGLLGSSAVKFYDVIGDTVNTAKRIESAAGAGEILISGPVREAVQSQYQVRAPLQVQVKGKDAPIEVYPIALNGQP